MRIFFSFLTLLFLLNSLSAEERWFGGLVSDPRTSSVVKINNDIEKVGTVKSSCIISEGIPPVGDQSGQGSCTCWAFGYYCKTYVEWQEHGWDVNDPRNQFSPSFIFNQINGGGGILGSTSDDALLLMQLYGVCSYSDMPYVSSDYYSYPSAENYYTAAFHKNNASYYTSFGDLTPLKQHLSNGNICVIHISCYENFYYIDEENPFYAATQKTGAYQGGHMVAVVGYDDSIPTPDGPGAIKCVNSWGTDWGDGGYFWIPYRAMTTAYYFANLGFWWFEGKTGYEPQLFASFNITHDKRDIAGIGIYTGSRSSPQNSILINNWWIDDYRTTLPLYFDDFPFPSTNMLFDITEFAMNNPDSVFLTLDDTIEDSVYGSINSFKVVTKYGDEIYADDTPVFLPDSGISFSSLCFSDSGGAAIFSAEPDSVIFDYGKEGETDTSSFYIANVSPSTDMGVIYYYSINNNSFWIENLTLENDTVLLGDSIKISIEVDSSWLPSGEVFKDTLAFFCSADSLAKGSVLYVPIILATSYSGTGKSDLSGSGDILSFSFSQTDNLLRVSAAEEWNSELRIKDVSGRSVLTLSKGIISKGNHVYDLSGRLSSGTYFLYCGKEKAFNFKIIR